MTLLFGTDLASHLQAQMKSQIVAFKKKPALAVILVGFHPPSHTYVEGKRKACLSIGMESFIFNFEETVLETTVLKKIQELNQDPLIDGILLQSPLPPHFDTKKLICAIDPSKDVDGFHPLNMGYLLRGENEGFIPCTPLGILRLLEHYKIQVSKKHVVIVGRSNIVGKPLAALLLQNSKSGNATVTVAHSQTLDLEKLTLSADILVAALGKPQFIKAHMVKEGAVVIDVGINRVEDSKSSKGYRLVGDVDFEAVLKKCSAITPVPKGVGPMTIAMLLHNTLLSYSRRNS